MENLILLPWLYILVYPIYKLGIQLKTTYTIGVCIFFIPIISGLVLFVDLEGFVLSFLENLLAIVLSLNAKSLIIRHRRELILKDLDFLKSLSLNKDRIYDAVKHYNSFQHLVDVDNKIYIRFSWGEFKIEFNNMIQVFEQETLIHTYEKKES